MGRLCLKMRNFRRNCRCGTHLLIFRIFIKTDFQKEINIFLTFPTKNGFRETGNFFYPKMLTLRAQSEPLSHNMGEKTVRRCGIVSDEDGVLVLLIPMIDTEHIAKFTLQKVDEGLEKLVFHGKSAKIDEDQLKMARNAYLFENNSPN